ncbi:unnamed protein product [Caenorhabditis brenneri]
MNRFPLIRLPYVAFREVILSIDKSDVFSLALSSRKTRRLINSTKNSVQKLSNDVIDGLSAKDKLNIAQIETIDNSRKVTIRLVHSEQLLLTFRCFCEGNSLPKALCESNSLPTHLHQLYFEIQINSINEKIEGKQEIMRFGNIDVPVIVKTKDIICTLWDDIDYGFQVMRRYFLHLFKFNYINIKVNPERTDNSKFFQTLKTSIAILKSRLEEKSDLWVENIELMAEADLHLLFHDMKYNNIEAMGHINRRFPDHFQCESMRLSVVDAKGFSLKNLMNSKCNTVWLFGTQMTNRVMTKVLKHWLDGKLETLQTLKLDLIENVEIETILAGLSDRTGHNLDRKEESISIIRGDRKRAVIRVPNETETFEMKIY